MRTDDLFAIHATVARLVHAVDARRWDELRTCFADVVRTDYTSLVGGAPEETPADRLVAAWSRRLGVLDATQHLLGPIDATVEGDAGTARCHVRAYHIARGAPGGDEWTIAGHYVFGLARAAAGGAFVVRSMTLETYYRAGNEALLAEAAAAARTGGRR